MHRYLYNVKAAPLKKPLNLISGEEEVTPREISECVILQQLGDAAQHPLHTLQVLILNLTLWVSVAEQNLRAGLFLKPVAWYDSRALPECDRLPTQTDSSPLTSTANTAEYLRNADTWTKWPFQFIPHSRRFPAADITAVTRRPPLFNCKLQLSVQTGN